MSSSAPTCHDESPRCRSETRSRFGVSSRISWPTRWTACNRSLAASRSRRRWWIEHAELPAVRVTVADTGRGMTADETGRIFNDFYTTKEGGTGLGLSIVRRLVMDLNGTVGVESAPGTGTRITIDIPASREPSSNAMTLQVLVVDDVPAMAEQYAYDLKRVGRYNTTVAAGGEAALDLLAREPIDCVVLDLEMPGTDGFEVLRRLQQRGIDTPVIVYTGTGSYDRCVQAVRLGAYGFVDKAEPIERVVQEIENAVSRGRLVKELRSLQSRFDGETSLIGDSAPMRSLRRRHRARRADSEHRPDRRRERHWQGARRARAASTGTGREDAAGRRQQRGAARAARRERALRPRAWRLYRCRSAAPGRVRERGQRDAVPRRDRRAAAAGAGQAAARARRTEGDARRWRPGDRDRGARRRRDEPRPRAARSRLGRFRQDLFYRLNVHTLRVPPLRERLSDVPALVDHLLRTIAAQLRVRPKTIAPEAVALLAAYDWRKNNVRELRNCLERMMIASDTAVIGADDVPPEIRGDERDEAADATAAPGTLKALKAQAERQIVLAALDRHDWHVTRTAEALGLADHSSLLKIMRRHGLSKARLETVVAASGERPRGELAWRSGGEIARRSDRSPSDHVRLDTRGRMDTLPSSSFASTGCSDPPITRRRNALQPAAVTLAAGSAVALLDRMKLRPLGSSSLSCLCLARASRRRRARGSTACRQDALSILLRRRRRSRRRSSALEGHARRRRHHRRDRRRDRPAGVRESRHAAHSCPLRLSCLDAGGRLRHDA